MTDVVRITDLEEVAALSAGAFVAVDANAQGTRRYDLGAFVESVSGRGLVWDGDAGWYTNESVSWLLASRRDGLAYGVSVPKGASMAGTKLGANAGIAAPVPGYVGHPAVDHYAGRGPFLHLLVNGIVDPDGTPHVTAFEGDGRFRRDGSNGDVWVLAPVLWTREADGDDAVELWVSDTRLPGYSAQPQAYLPDGSLRPYMLYARYAGVMDADGRMHSYGGHPVWKYNVSHNSLITQTDAANTGYSGKSVADDWYVKAMFLLKYATKHSQSVFAGCSGFSYQYAPAVAETGVTRVVLTEAQAAGVDVGSSWMLGTYTAGSSDRNAATCHDVFDGARVLRKEAYASGQVAVYFDVAASFDTDTTYLLSTCPWGTGATDAVEGDGTPTLAGRTNGHEPFQVQGIELSLGLYEVLGDVIISNDGTTGWVPYVNHDSRNEATSLTSAYVPCATPLPTGEADAWHYPMYPASSSGLLYGVGDGGSQSTGMCDGTYTNKLATTGLREWLGLGYLNFGGGAGLWCVGGGDGLGAGAWVFGSRLSGTGRGRA